MNRGKVFKTISEVQRGLPNLLALSILLLFSQIVKSQNLFKVDSLEAVLVKTEKPKTRLDVLNHLSSAMMDINIRKAEQYADSALLHGNRIDYPYGLADAYYNKGRERWLNAYYNDAEYYFKQSLNILYTLNDSVKIAFTNRYLGLSYYYHAENDSALKYHFRAMSIDEAQGNLKNLVQDLENIALSYQQLGRFDKAIEYSTEALQIKLGSPSFLGRTNDYDYNRYVFSKIAFNDEITYLKNVLNEEFLKGNDNNNISRMLNNIGSLYNTIGEYDTAVHYLRRASEVNKKLGIPYRYAGYLNELGQSLQNNGQLKEAEDIFMECLNIWDSVGHRTSMAIVRYNLAKVYNNLNLLNDALFYANSSFDIATSMIQNPFLTRLYYLKSDIYLNLNDFESAESYALSGIKMSHEIDVIKSIMQGNAMLAMIYRAEGNYNLALMYTEKYAQLKDSLYFEENSLKIAKIKTDYETKNKNKEIELLNAQSFNQLAVIKTRNLILIFTLSAILFMAFVLYRRSLYTKRANIQLLKIEEQNTELAKRNSEKDLLMGEIHHRVKNNLQVISSILNLQSRKLADMGAKDAIQEGRNRVKAMALIHQHLYKHDEYAYIGIAEYLLTLINTVAYSFGYNEESFILNTNIDSSIKLDIDSGIKLGLILNELITNVFKHAFSSNKQNILKIAFAVVDSTATLTVADNGPGVTWEKLENSGSFGIFLVKNLVDDMEGEVQLENDVGTHIHLTLKLIT